MGMSETGRPIASTMKIVPPQKWLLALTSRTPTCLSPTGAATACLETILRTTEQ